MLHIEKANEHQHWTFSPGFIENGNFFIPGKNEVRNMREGTYIFSSFPYIFIFVLSWFVLKMDSE